MFVACPPDRPRPGRDLYLVRATRGTFSEPAEFLSDPANRGRVAEYLADMARPYAREVPAELGQFGQSYGEMAGTLIGQLVSPGEPVDLLVLAFSMHDLRPGRQTAAYLSHLTPGAPMAFAICDQGSAAAFTGLRIAREYVSSAGISRALVVVAEQAVVPYGCPAPVPSQHRAVAMLYTAVLDRAGPGERAARVADVRQHPGVLPAEAAGLACADLAEMAAGHDEVGLVLSHALGAVWPAPAAGRVRVTPAGQPSTEVWWGLIDELAGAGHTRLLVAADYDPDLRYLCLTAFDHGA